MDAARRGALMRAGKMALGAVGAASLSNGTLAQPTQAAPRVYPRINNWGSGSFAVDEPDPIFEARHKKVRELEDRMYREVNPRWRLTDNMHTDNSSYLPALKSTAPWWRAHVMQEQMKRKQRAMDTLQEQIQKILESPLDKLKDMADEALGAFMEELSKP